MYLKNNFYRFMLILWAAMGCIFSNVQAEDYDDSYDAIDFDISNELPVFQQQNGCDDITAQLLASLLVDEFDALCLFAPGQDFYLHTNELNQRSLLDYGLFLPHKFFAHRWTLGGHFFYNQTTRDNYTRTSTALCSYLAIFNDTLLQEIQRRINQNQFDLGIHLPDVVPLFANATVQERRTGFMFHGMRRWRDYRFRFLFPFYYLESNLFLTPEEIDDIQAELGITDPVDDMQFARKNLIADKLGFGDLRLNFDFPLAVTPHTTTKLGLQATIPTAFAVKSGLYGSTFKKRCRGPVLDFCQLFNLATEDPAQAEAVLLAFAQAALEQFNANLIELPMGNGGHFGLGIYMRSKTKLSSIIRRPWADNISIRSRMSAEYLFERRQKRYFIECGNPAFDALGLNQAIPTITERINEDPTYARAVLKYFETQLTDKAFPFSLSTRVRPGMVLRWMTKYMYEADTDWGWYVGSDNWLITREKLSGIRVPASIPKNLNLRIARKPFAYQFGIIGSLFWQRPNNLYVSINGQYNFGSVGIGDDFLLTINVEKTF